MFGLFKKDPLVNLQKSYNQLLEEAMQLQRKGDIKGYAAKMAESEIVMNEIEKIKNQFPLKPLVVVINKIDLLSETEILNIKEQLENLNIKLENISAKNNLGIEELKNQLLSFFNTGALRNNETIVTNSRHYDSLLKALEEIQKVKWGLDAGISSDLMAIDIRSALFFFGEITGEVTNDELLGNIFANFCIGK